MKDNVPGGRYWEPGDEQSLVLDWEEFEAWVEENDGIPADPELPFN